MKSVLFSILVFILATVISYQLLTEAAVYYEMQSTGAASRVELADDFGLGLLGLFFVMPGSVIIGAVSSWLTWRKFKVGRGVKGENT